MAATRNEQNKQTRPNGLVAASRDHEMNAHHQWKGRQVERRVTYTLDVNGQLFVIENVPARVNAETGEQLFSPDTVERLQKVWQQGTPKRVIQVPVYEYASARCA